MAALSDLPSELRDNARAAVDSMDRVPVADYLSFTPNSAAPALTLEGDGDGGEDDDDDEEGGEEDDEDALWETDDEGEEEAQ